MATSLACRGWLRERRSVGIAATLGPEPYETRSRMKVGKGRVIVGTAFHCFCDKLSLSL